jgi:hypothetical protein
MPKNNVLVSFYSGDDGLARRLLTEAAKAIPYGGLDPQESLQLVPKNPAKPPMVDKYVGSLKTEKGC